jgi:hypothetical protein
MLDSDWEGGYDYIDKSMLTMPRPKEISQIVKSI